MALRLSAELGRRVSEGAKNRIDSSLVASALRLEPFKDVLVDAQRDKRLGRCWLQPLADNAAHDGLHLCFRVLGSG